MKLVKEIKSKKGVVHFRRWRIFSLPWFSVNVHAIYKEDQDNDLHNHPWNIWTIILSGSYVEVYWDDKTKSIKYKIRKRFNIGYRKSDEFHRIGLIRGFSLKPVYTLAIIGKRKEKEWGYLTDDGFVDHKEYRKIKRKKYKR